MMSDKTTLELWLYADWFDRINAGEITEDYRPLTPAWLNTFFTQKITHIRYRKAGKPSETLLVELKGVTRGKAHPDHPAPKECDVYVLKLGDV